ncbi:hypothetical protein GCM10022221_68410 [Actinocorallia aurea]
MVELSGRAAYLQVADHYRDQIRADELRPGDVLPSLAVLARRHGVSVSVAKTAVGVLRTEGLVIGQQGRGVFVADRAAPSEAKDGTAALVEELMGELQALRARVTALETEVKALRR